LKVFENEKLTLMGVFCKKVNQSMRTLMQWMGVVMKIVSTGWPGRTIFWL